MFLCIIVGAENISFLDMTVSDVNQIGNGCTIRTIYARLRG